MKNQILSFLLLAASPVIAGTTTASFEQSLPASDTPSWFYRCAIYGWGQSLDGDIAVRGQFADVAVGLDDVLDNLDLAFMGAFEVGRGRWSVLLDVNYAKLSESVTTRPGRMIDLEQQQFVGNLAVLYGVVRNESVSFDLYAGARANWLEVDIDRGLAKRSADESWIDPIAGMRCRVVLSPSFYLRAAADIGGFGVASDLTWQAMAGFGWRFNESGGLFLGYRAIGTDFSDGGFTYDVVAHGPLLGMEFTF